MSNHSISPPFGIAKPKRKRPIKHLAINHVMLELPYAIETSTLEPSHKYVGWVVVDGEPLYERTRNSTKEQNLLIGSIA
ncbi:hypothetical protein JHK85_045657 [Glycine max]|nr:hypothetical protein JHK85_045657 [Glycine max]